MSDLKPCPFCGGDVKLKADDSGGYSIECGNHEWPKERFTQEIPGQTIAADVLMCSWGQGEEAKQALIEAWNTREERTCKPTEEDCCPICGEDLVRCNVGIGFFGGAVELDPPIYHNYCPSCGAKVVER